MNVQTELQTSKQQEGVDFGREFGTTIETDEYAKQRSGAQRRSQATVPTSNGTAESARRAALCLG